MATTDMVPVRNKTGEERYIATVGEEGYPVHRVVGDDELIELPKHLAERLAEQPGFELDGKPKRSATASKSDEKTDEGKA